MAYIPVAQRSPEDLERIRAYDRARYGARREALAVRRKERYKREREIKLAQRKSRHGYDPRPLLLAGAKRRANDKFIEFSITIKDIPLPKVCPVFGIPIVHGGFSDGSASIDRIDNTKGYVPGNVIIMSQKANRLKNNGTAAEHRAIAEFMEKHGCR